MPRIIAGGGGCPSQAGASLGFTELLGQALSLGSNLPIRTISEKILCFAERKCRISMGLPSFVELAHEEAGREIVHGPQADHGGVRSGRQCAAGQAEHAIPGRGFATSGVARARTISAALNSNPICS